MCEQGVQLFAAGALLAFGGAVHGRLHGLLDKGVPHIRQCGVAVQPAFLLHLHHTVLNGFQLVLIQRKLLLDVRIALDQLGGGKAPRNTGFMGVVLDLVDHSVDAPVHRAGRAQIPLGGHLPGLYGALQHVHQLADALVFGGADGHHRQPQRIAELFHVNAPAIGPHFVHHVQRHHHGDAQIHHLHGQVQVALDVGGVHNVQDRIGLLLQKKIPRYDLLAGIRADGVDAGQIDHAHLPVAQDLAAFLLHRHARKVAHVLIGAGELVEQRGFAAVLVACQCDDHTLPPSFTGSTVMRAASALRSVSR